MKAPAMIGVGVLAAATALVTATAGGGTKEQLPLPQAALPGHHPPSGGSTAGGSTASESPSPGADPSASASNSAASQQPVYSAGPPPALTGCVVSVSNRAPLRGQTAETAGVRTTAGASVRLEADYVRTRSVHAGIADGSGYAYFSLGISHAEPGVTVPVTATVSLRGAKYSCSTSFTPVDPVGLFPTAGGQTGGQ